MPGLEHRPRRPKHLIGRSTRLAGCRKLATSMKLDIQKPLRRMPVVVLPMYGVVQYTTLVRREPRVSLYVIELPRKALGLPCDELLALLASDPLQEFVGRWRLNPVGTPKQDEFESLLRCEMNGLQQAMFRRRQRLLDWEQHRVLVHRCAADAIACMDRRSLRGKAVKLAGESPDGMPAAVQVYKWGYEMAAKASSLRAHGYDPSWDLEFAAIAFGEELELELSFIDPSIAERLRCDKAHTNRDFEAERTKRWSALQKREHAPPPVRSRDANQSPGAEWRKGRSSSQGSPSLQEPHQAPLRQSAVAECAECGSRP